MLKNIFLSAILIVLFLVGHAQADNNKNGMYFGAFGGVSILEDPKTHVGNIEVSPALTGGVALGPIFQANGVSNSKTGYNFGGAIGYRLNSIRLEGEFGYTRNELNSVKGDVSANLPAGTIGIGFEEDIDFKVETFSYMGNIYYDLHNSSKFTPYIFAGLGGVKIKVTDNPTGTNDSDNVFAYKMGLGIEGEVVKNISLYSDYSYFGTSEAKFDTPLGISKTNYKRHNINFGMRYYF